jgi:hypothetical protein
MRLNTIYQAGMAAAVFGLTATPAFADDCALVIAALTASAKTPSNSTITHTGPGGKPVINHMVQTATAKYVETDGKWKSMNVSIQETLNGMNEMIKTAKMSCHRTGAESVNGQPVTVYAVHVENQGTTSDSKIWVSAKNLQLKSEMTVGDTHFVTTADYDHVQVPTNATPMGK